MNMKKWIVFCILPIGIGFLNALGADVLPTLIPQPSPLSFSLGFLDALVILWVWGKLK